MEINPTLQVAQAIEQYGRPQWVAYVPTRVRKMVPYEVIMELLEGAQPSEGSVSKDDKKDKAMRWCQEHLFEEVTVKQIAEIGGLGESSARTLITSRPDVFRKLGRGVYEIRDPQADRGRVAKKRAR